jgi:hypothetical protein
MRDCIKNKHARIRAVVRRELALNLELLESLNLDTSAVYLASLREMWANPLERLKDDRGCLLYFFF